MKHSFYFFLFSLTQKPKNIKILKNMKRLKVDNRRLRLFESNPNVVVEKEENKIINLTLSLKS